MAGQWVRVVVERYGSMVELAAIERYGRAERRHNGSGRRVLGRGQANDIRAWRGAPTAPLLAWPAVLVCVAIHSMRPFAVRRLYSDQPFGLYSVYIERWLRSAIAFDASAQRAPGFVLATLVLPLSDGN